LTVASGIGRQEIDVRSSERLLATVDDTPEGDAGIWRGAGGGAERAASQYEGKAEN
jgi:hypothetical protein